MSTQPRKAATDVNGAASRRRQPVSVAPYPIAMTISDAQDYSGLSRKRLNDLTKSGKLDRRRLGANGAFIVMRQQLDAAIAEAFSEEAGAIETDFDFG